MNDPSTVADHHRAVLAAACLANPPAPLRERVLDRHARRRLLARTTPLVLLLAVVGALRFAAVSDRPYSPWLEWQARSAALESTWRETSDPDWLRSDARARPLLHRLREVDLALGRLHALAPSDDAALTRLWRERSETLSLLIDSRRQGGLAIRL